MNQRSLSVAPFRVLLVLTLAQVFPMLSAAQSSQQTELASGWRLSSALHLQQTGAVISTSAFDASRWYPIHRVPATVLEILEEDGVYPNLYFGMNLLKTVPQDLYKQDWWYRTSFSVPASFARYQLEFTGINYRAEIWLNGHRLADNTQIVGMYVAHELDISQWVHAGAGNVLAVKVTPERRVQDVDGVELADSWHDWINWNYLGLVPPGKGDHGVSLVPDRNAGIWRPVYLRWGGNFALDHPAVNTALPLPATDRARLTVYMTVHNLSEKAGTGTVRLAITRRGKPPIHIEQVLNLLPHETRDIEFSPDRFPQLAIRHPDLWWPYTLGKPNLYDLDAQVLDHGAVSDRQRIRFGIRVITQHRDNDEEFPSMGRGGSFYLTVNGKDFLIRGAVYSPDLLYRYDPAREAMVLRYVKDMGLNLLRWESKISSEHILDLADEEGIPVMMGWMCCAQWEHWSEWDKEDHHVAVESLRSQIWMLRRHPSAVIWANGSDGLPPPDVLRAYHDVLDSLHWQNAVVDTVSSRAKSASGAIDWSGIHMRGPYTWRPPSYWFSGTYAASRGACAEQGDNEHIPTYEGLQKFIPKEKLWPINEEWFFHAGANQGNSTLKNIRRVIDQRYGPCTSAEEFSRKAQVSDYEDTRAQFESFAAGRWSDHKMTVYWMLNDPWPSFFGQLFDYSLQPGGAYFGAKKGLRPLSVVFDSYATGDHTHAAITAVNQTAQATNDLRVRVRVYDLQGHLDYQTQKDHVHIPPYGNAHVFDLPRMPDAGTDFFVRCDLLSVSGATLEENVYWQSQKGDDLGSPSNDLPFGTEESVWADFTPLASMPQIPLDVTAHRLRSTGTDTRIAVELHNSGPHIAFFERAEVTATQAGTEILPVLYSDNYVTVFPGETVRLVATLPKDTAKPDWIRVSGYDTRSQVTRIH